MDFNEIEGNKFNIRQLVCHDCKETFENSFGSYFDLYMALRCQSDCPFCGKETNMILKGQLDNLESCKKLNQEISDYKKAQG